MPITYNVNEILKIKNEKKENYDITVAAPKTGTISANALNVAATTSSLLSRIPKMKC